MVELVRELAQLSSFGPLTELYPDAPCNNLSIHEIDPFLYGMPFGSVDSYRPVGVSASKMLSATKQVSLHDFIRGTAKFENSKAGLPFVSNAHYQAYILEAILMRADHTMSDMWAWKHFDLTKLITTGMITFCSESMLFDLVSSWEYSSETLKSNTILPAFILFFIEHLGPESSTLMTEIDRHIDEPVAEMACKFSTMTRPQFNKEYMSEKAVLARSHKVVHSGLPERLDYDAINEMYLKIVRS